MINILFNPLLQKKQIFSNTNNVNINIKSNVSLTTAILSLFSLTVVSYMLFWIFCNGLILDNTFSTLPNIKNFALVSGTFSFIIVFLVYYKQELSPLLAPLYALFSGIFISGLSFISEQKYPGIALLTVEITLATFIFLYIGYKFGFISVTQKFKAIVYTMIGTISFIYIFSFLLLFFDIKVPLIHDTGIGGIAWSTFIMVTASFHLLIDIDKVENNNSSKGYKNWHLALGLMVSLIWLYLSVLRLSLKIKRK